VVEADNERLERVIERLRRPLSGLGELDEPLAQLGRGQRRELDVAEVGEDAEVAMTAIVLPGALL
jgi:hypothetical protein